MSIIISNGQIVINGNPTIDPELIGFAMLDLAELVKDSVYLIEDCDNDE